MKAVVLIGILCAACGTAQQHPANMTSSLNYPAGKYQDYADYLMQNDQVLQQDAKARGATQDQTYCVAKEYSEGVLGIDYRILSEAVSGQRQITRQDELRAQGRLKMAIDNHTAPAITEAAWNSCMG